MSWIDNIQAYMNHFLDLIKEISQERGDGPKADELRNHMDLEWAKLTESQQNFIRRMAEEIHKLENEQA